MLNEKYTPEQMTDAKHMCEIIKNVPHNKRAIFAMMMESMILGAEIAEKAMVKETEKTA